MYSLVSIGSSTRTSARVTFIRQSPLFSASRVPTTARGRIGTCASMAMRNAPSLNSPIVPSSVRVPSGKTITLTRLPSRSRMPFMADTMLSRLPRTSLMSPAMRISQPTIGYLKKSSLESHFISHGRWDSSSMSTKLSWLATTMYGRRGSLTFSPLVRNDHSGLSTWWTTHTLRNSQPGQ